MAKKAKKKVVRKPSKSKDVVQDDLRKIRRQIEDLLLTDISLKACITALETWRESCQGLSGRVNAPVDVAGQEN